MHIISNPHGKYVIDLSHLESNIFILRLVGSWNIETAEECLNECYQVVDKYFIGKTWAFLNNLTQWELCTPEVMEYFNSNSSKFTAMGCSAQAVITHSRVDQMVTGEIHNNAESQDFKTQYFQNETDAIEWLESALQ